MNTSTSSVTPAADADADAREITQQPIQGQQPSQESGQPSGPNVEALPESEESDAATPPLDIEALISQARHEGYIRGRNEQIAASMNAPALFENPSPQSSLASLADGFLSAVRPSVWD